jgi:hypothetical protein
MGKYSFEEIRFIKHLWIQNYDELGLAKTISRVLSSHYLLTIASIILWLVLAPNLTDNILILITPFILVGLSFLLIMVDGFYSSFKVLSILDMCRKYIDPNMSLDDLFYVMKE